jgi:hypothetical protein
VNDLVELGTQEVLLPILGWGALFGAVTLAIGILVFWRCRRWLREAGRSLNPAQGILGVALFVATPVAAGWLGAGFAWRRATAKIVEAGGDGAQRWIVKHPIATGWTFYEPYTLRGKDAAVGLVTEPLYDGAFVRLCFAGGLAGGGNLAALVTVKLISRRRSG